ncbi:amine sulfotransferase-like [Branchiostoma lanceolatum]|uniref:amine sulfotransferase-like n=1 Tax=Branchiostoma lanceolatum TaxID=7740 RepID=UPI003452B1A0
MPNLFEYKGAFFDPLLTTKEMLDIMPDYVIRDDDVVIVTYLKAGTNWTIEIVNKLLMAAGRIEPHENDIPWYLEAEVPGFGKPTHVILADQPSPRIIHTHLPRYLAPKMMSSPTGKVKVIVVMRNPKDTAVSLYHFLAKVGPLQDASFFPSWDLCAQDFLDGKTLGGDFYDHALGWWQMRDDPRFLFLKYEDMNKDLNSAVRKIMTFLDVSLDDVTLSSIVESCTFDSLKAVWTESRIVAKPILARKGMVGDWKNTFTAAQSKAYDAKYRERLEGTGLQFDFE